MAYDPARLAPRTGKSLPMRDSSANRTRMLHLPGGWLTAAIPVLWLAGLGGWVWIRWSALPPMIPVHWQLATGVPDYWVRRTPSAVLTVMGTMGAICLAFIGLAWLMLQQPTQSPTPEAIAAERTFRRQTALLIVASAWFVAFAPGFSVLPLPEASFRIWTVAFAATLLTGIIALVRSGLRMRR